VDQNGNTLNFFAASKLKKEMMTHWNVPPSMASPAAVVIDYFVSSKKRKLVKLKPYQLDYLTGEIY
jgi:hypothetical protein